MSEISSVTFILESFCYFFEIVALGGDKAQVDTMWSEEIQNLDHPINIECRVYR
jgi:hypothetical protein